MTGGSKIVGLFADQAPRRVTEGDVMEIEQDDPMLAEARTPYLAPSEPLAPPSPLLPALFALLAILWVAFAVVAAMNGYAGRTPSLAETAGLIATVAAPLGLIGVLYLLAASATRRRAGRFAADAAAIRGEADLIQGRMTLLVEQAEALRATVDLAAERLAESGGRSLAESERLQSLASGAHDAAAAAAAKIREASAGLPEADARVRGVTATLEEALMSAIEGTGALEARVEAVAERARAADGTLAASAKSLAQQVRAVDEASETAAGRIGAQAETIAASSDAALARALAAAEEARTSLDGQAQAIAQLADQTRVVLESAGETGRAALAERLAAVTAEVGAIGTELARHGDVGTALLDRLRAGLTDVSIRLASLDQEALPTTERLTGALSALGDQTDRLTGSLAHGSTLAEALMARAEQLLAALDANAREIDETLPSALARLDQAAQQARTQLGNLAPAIEAAGDKGDRLHAAVSGVTTMLGEQEERLFRLASFATNADAQARGIVDGSGADLVEMMVRVREAAGQAADRARETVARIVPEITEALAAAGDDALRPAMAERVQAQIRALEQAATQAVTAADTAAVALTDRVTTIADATAALDARLGEAGGSVSSERFAGRVSQIIDALNAASVDVAAALRVEASDPEWQAYLDGDRSLFTRRAAQLVETAGADALAARYRADPALRDTIDRFVRDVEAMLRAAVATREGGTLGVTLLSSDIGKLYAALVRVLDGRRG